MFSPLVVLQISFVVFLFAMPVLLFVNVDRTLNKVILYVFAVIVGLGSGLGSTYLGSKASYKKLVKKYSYRNGGHRILLFAQENEDILFKSIANKLDLSDTNNSKDELLSSSRLGVRLSSIEKAEKIRKDLNADLLIAIQEPDSPSIDENISKEARSILASNAYAKAGFFLSAGSDQIALASNIGSDIGSDPKVDTFSRLTFPTSTKLTIISDTESLNSYLFNLVMGHIYYDKAEFPKAIDAFESILNLVNDEANTSRKIPETDWSEIYNYLGASYFRVDSLSKSIDILRTSIKQNPKDVFAHVFLARALYNMTCDFDSALQHLNTAINLNPQYVYAYYSKGIIYSREKDFPNAISAYNKAIRLDPNFLKAKHNLAVTYLKVTPSRLDDAQQLLEKIIQIDKDYALAYYNLICVYLRQNKTQFALKFLSDNQTLLARQLPFHGNKSPLDYAKTDPDFNSIRNHQIFLDVLNRHSSPSRMSIK